MSIFNPILERMAAGQVDQLYAHVRIRMDKEKMIFDKNMDGRGSFWIDSVNQVPVCGTIHALHSAIQIVETSFQGDTQIHYSYDRSLLPDAGTVEETGILIQYNGGEIVLPFSVSDSGNRSWIKKEPETQVQPVGTGNSHALQVKKQLAQVSRGMLSYLVLKEKQGSELELSEILLALRDRVEELVHLKPEVIRYRLYEAILAVKCHDLARAKSLDKVMRNMVASARKTHGTEFCLLRYLEYEIAKSSQNAQEASEMKKQLQTFLPHLLKNNPHDPELICLLGCECIQMNLLDPMAMWEILHDAYEEGNNSPFLYFQGLRLLQSLMLDMDSEYYGDPFVLHCLCAGSKYGLLNRELASRIMKETSVMSVPYLYHLYRNLYEVYPEPELLSELCRMMIRLDVKNSEGFTYYQKGVQSHLRLAKLFDYYMAALPDGYDQPVDREVLLYYATDSYVNPDIYLKLCLNMIQFYEDDQEICDQYAPHIEAFVRTQLSHKRISGELAELADFIITPDNLDSRLADQLYPLLHYVQVRGEVPDHTRILYQDGIYDRFIVEAFHFHQVKISMPGGLGKIQLMDQKGSLIGGVSLEITPLIQNEELIRACEQLCKEKEECKLVGHARWLMNQNLGETGDNSEGEACDLQTCLEYMKQEGLSPLLKKDALKHVHRSSGLNYLLRQGLLEEAVEMWNRIPKEELKQEEVYDLLQQVFQSGTMIHELQIERMFMWLLERNGLDADLLSRMTNQPYRPMEVQIQILAACRDQGIPHLELSAAILQGQLLSEEKDWPMVQSTFEELVNHDRYRLMNQAAMSVICHGTLFSEIEPKIDLAAFIQGEIMHSGSSDALTDLVKLAFMKQMQKEAFLSEHLTSLRRQLCTELLKKGYELEFLQREAMKLGLPSYPVITVNLSKEGPFGESMEEMVYVHKELLWVEYRVNDQNELYTSPADHAYGCLYSAKILAYAGEEISYRIRFGDRYTSWISLEGWNYPLRNQQGLSERYGMLQQLALEGVNGGIQAETMQNYEVIMELIQGFGHIM